LAFGIEYRGAGIATSHIEVGQEIDRHRTQHAVRQAAKMACFDCIQQRFGGIERLKPGRFQRDLVDGGERALRFAVQSGIAAHLAEGDAK